MHQSTTHEAFSPHRATLPVILLAFLAYGQFAEFVDPFLGASGGGNVFPGAQELVQTAVQIEIARCLTGCQCQVGPAQPAQKVLQETLLQDFLGFRPALLASQGQFIESLACLTRRENERTGETPAAGRDGRAIPVVAGKAQPS